MLTHFQVLTLAHAIYLAEGGSNLTHYPYGIKDAKVLSVVSPSKACENTIIHFFNKDHPNWNLNRNTIAAFSNRYCPPSVDKVGNKNWRRNVCKILKIK